MLKNERIRKWEEEMERIAASQKEYSQKCSEKIRELKRKISEEQQLLVLENNRMIAEAVRAVYGEVNEKNIQSFMEQMKTLSSHRQEEVRADERPQ